MKAQLYKNSEIHCRPAIARPGAAASSWPLLPGLLLSDIGLLLIAFAGLDALSARAHTLFYSSGAILCLVGLVLIWIGTIELARTAYEPAKGSRKIIS